MRVLPLLVAAGGTAFIFYQWMGGRPFWVDEQMIAMNIRDRSLAELAGPLWFGQSAPLGWLALLFVTLCTFGMWLSLGQRRRRPARGSPPQPEPLEGCISVQPARIW